MLWNWPRTSVCGRKECVWSCLVVRTFYDRPPPIAAVLRCTPSVFGFTTLNTSVPTWYQTPITLTALLSFCLTVFSGWNKSLWMCEVSSRPCVRPRVRRSVWRDVLGRAFWFQSVHRAIALKTSCYHLLWLITCHHRLSQDEYHSTRGKRLVSLPAEL